MEEFELEMENSVQITTTEACGDDERTDVTSDNNTKTGVGKFANLRLKEVSYSGTKMHVIRQDDDSGDYTAPHWKDGNDDGDASDPGERRFPVAFTRNTSVDVSAKFRIEPADVVKNVTVKGEANNGMGTITKKATVNGNVVEITNESLPNKLPNQVDFFNTLDIEWKFSVDEGEQFCSAGRSDNRVYVTLNDPIQSNGGNTYNSTVLFESVVDIACRNGKGESTEAKAIRAMWNEFTDRSVRRKQMDGFNNTDNTEMNYWNTSFGACQQSMDSLLADPNGFGSCVAWAELFHNVIRAQGISGSDVYRLDPDTSVNSGARQFLVKNWKFGKHIDPGSNGDCNTSAIGDDQQSTPVGDSPSSIEPCIGPGDNGVLDTTPSNDDTEDNGILSGAGIPYKHVLESGVWAPSGSSYGEDWGDVSDQQGAPGQANPDPPEFFANHWIVKYGGEFYDPSYGIGGEKAFNSGKKYENKAISGIKASIKAFGQTFDIAKQNEPAIKELKFTNLTP